MSFPGTDLDSPKQFVVHFRDVEHGSMLPTEDFEAETLEQAIADAREYAIDLGEVADCDVQMVAIYELVFTEVYRLPGDKNV